MMLSVHTFPVSKIIEASDKVVEAGGDINKLVLAIDDTQPNSFYVIDEDNYRRNNPEKLG